MIIMHTYIHACMHTCIRMQFNSFERLSRKFARPLSHGVRLLNGRNIYVCSKQKGKFKEKSTLNFPSVVTSSKGGAVYLYTIESTRHTCIRTYIHNYKNISLFKIVCSALSWRFVFATFSYRLCLVCWNYQMCSAQWIYSRLCGFCCNCLQRFWFVFACSLNLPFSLHILRTILVFIMCALRFFARSLSFFFFFGLFSCLQ